MRYALLCLVISVGIIASLLWQLKQFEKAEHEQVQRIVQMVFEDVEIIDYEADAFLYQIEDIFSTYDKHRIGQRLIAVLDSVTLLADNMLAEVSQYYEEGQALAPERLFSRYQLYRESQLACVDNYFRADTSFLQLSEGEIAAKMDYLRDLLNTGNIIDELSLQEIKLLELQIVRDRYNLVHYVGSMFCYRGRPSVHLFPTILDFSGIMPVELGKPVAVKIGLESYEEIMEEDHARLVIFGDTLMFTGREHLIDYYLPADRPGKQELKVQLLAENPLTGEPLWSERIFSYYVRGE